MMKAASKLLLFLSVGLVPFLQTTGQPLSGSVTVQTLV